MIIRVKSIEALSDFKTYLMRFLIEAWYELRSADRKITQTDDWLQERLNYWRHKVEQYEQEVWEAKKDLRYCKEDEDNDCSAEEEALDEARERLNHAKEELTIVRGWKQRIDEVSAEYHIQAERLKQLLNIEMPRADAFLGRAIEDLHKYITGISLSEQATLNEFISAPTDEGTSVKESTTRQIKDTRLRKAWEVLLTSKNGKAAAENIRQKCITVKFGYLPEDGKIKPGERGHYYPEEKEIVIRLDQQNKSINVLASLIAHEGTHVQWNKPNSLSQEYDAIRTQDEVWQELRGNERDAWSEKVHKLISFGEKIATNIIHDDNPDLPDV